MQRSSTLNPGSPTSPRRSGSDHPEADASPRTDAVRITPRSPNPHPELNAPLRMGDFYRTDTVFKQLRDALRPDPKAARFPFPLARLEELQKTIEVGVRDAEHCYTLTSHSKCALRLQAAKANQVALLGSIDDTPESELGAEKRATMRGSCVALGDMLTSMMIRVESLVRARTPGAQPPGANEDMPQPASPGTHQEQTRSPQKRAQGDQDSPVLKHTPPKRLKITEATTSTPAYRPVRQPALSPDSDDAGAERNVQTPDSAPKKKPQSLRSQPRPRQLSQRHTAPPDTSGHQQDQGATRKPATAPGSPQPDTATLRTADSGGPDAKSSGQRT